MPASQTAQAPAENPQRHHHRKGPIQPSGAPAEPAPRPPAESAEEMIRWAAFSCLLIPVVLTVYGTSFGGTACAALGLAAVTAVCRLLLRQSERAAGRTGSGRTETGEPRGSGRSARGTGAHRGSRATGEGTRDR